MIGKILNGALIEPSANEREKIVIANPTDEILKAVMGYRDVITESEPEYDIETQYLSLVYEETDGKIKASWEVKEMEAVSYVNDN